MNDPYNSYPVDYFWSFLVIDWFWSVKKLRDVSTGEVTCIFWYYSICPRQVKSYTITGIITRSWINNLKLIQKLKNYYFCHYKKYIPCWPLLHRPLLAVCSRSNSHRQTYNAGLFNAILRKITPFAAGVIRAKKVFGLTW